MNRNILRRYVIFMGIATVVMFTFWAFTREAIETPMGDYEVRQGDIFLSDKKYDEALERFDAALKVMPDHRGALMGRGIAYMQSGRIAEAEAEFTYLIDYLKKTLVPDDLTGVGTLASAYTNRGILYDRTGRYKKALFDYANALRTDEETVEGPGTISNVLYATPNPATVRKRATYLEKQLALPPEKRLLRVPEKDKEQRMYKP
jgi:tetratricopeptide (TPR) repeat protein